MGGGGGRIVAPELVDQALERDDLVRPQQQQCEHGSLFGAAEREHTVSDLSLERPEQAKGDYGASVRLAPSEARTRLVHKPR